MKRFCAGLCAVLFACAARGGEGLEDFSAWRERPLFAPGRRPPYVAPAPVVAASVAPVSAPPQLALVGVLYNGVANIALLRRASDLKPAAYRLGDEIDGWRITAIESRRVTLARQDRDITLEMAGAVR